jgi:hypothetical protein
MAETVLIVLGFACAIGLGVVAGVAWCASRQAVLERARALLRTGGVGEER